jgi:hypothetical protein
MMLRCVKRRSHTSLIAIITYGMAYGMEQIKKITVHIPVDLLADAQKETGEGVTETVRKGLEMLKRAHAYRQLAKMRGKIKFDLPLDQIRNDRR